MTFLIFEYWNNDHSKDLAEYQICVHAFENSRTPVVASYGGLGKIAELSVDKFGENVRTFVERDLQVDDGLTLLPTETEVIDLVGRTQNGTPS